VVYEESGHYHDRRWAVFRRSEPPTCLATATLRALYACMLQMCNLRRIPGVSHLCCTLALFSLHSEVNCPCVTNGMEGGIRAAALYRIPQSIAVLPARWVVAYAETDCRQLRLSMSLVS
jgi:hypothetical protein